MTARCLEQVQGGGSLGSAGLQARVNVIRTIPASAAEDIDLSG